MIALLLALVLVATSLVLFSGVWVTIALVKAVWRVDRPSSTPSAEAADKNAP